MVDLLEICGVVIVVIDIRVVLKCKVFVSFFDFVFGSVRWDIESGVGVFYRFVGVCYCNYIIFRFLFGIGVWI